MPDHLQDNPCKHLSAPPDKRLRITFLGTGGGTEPMPGFRHMSVALEHRGALYFFDAGDNCSYAACTGGLDLLTTRAVFISHTDMDHIGGLPNLLWNLRKINGRLGPESSRPFSGKTLDIFMPHGRSMPAILELLASTGSNFHIDFAIRENVYADGIIFNENGLQVTALHNQHLPLMDGKPVSFSFRIEADGRALVYSGDVKSIQDFELLIEDADLVLMETGHHEPRAVCEYLAASNLSFGRLGLVHHGRTILSDPDGEEQKVRAILGDRVFVARDGMRCEL